MVYDMDYSDKVIALPESSLHENISSACVIMFIQGRRVFDNGGRVKWYKALNNTVSRRQ